MGRVKKVQISYLRKILTHLVMVLTITIKSIFRKTAGASGICECIVYMVLL